MRILLVNSNFYKLPVPTIPFGLCYVASSLDNAGYEVEVLDLCFSKNPYKEVVAKINQSTFDVIGVSIRNIDTCATYDPFFLIQDVKNKVIEPIKENFAGPIVIGGAAIGVNGEEILDFLELDYAIHGDGEKAMVEFVQRLETQTDMHGLAGLIWKKDGKLAESNPPSRIHPIDSIPHARIYDHIDLEPYKNFKSPIQIQTKRGCSLNCVYCTYRKIEGETFRLRSPQAVADEIEEIYRKTGYGHIEFTDSTFNFPLDHAKSVLRAIIAKNLPLQLQTMGLNPGAFDEEFADLLKEARFKEIQVGVDSGSDTTLKSLNKNYSRKDILKVGSILRKKKIPVLWYILTGAPDETKETLRQTLETIKQASSPWDLVVWGNGIRVYKGAPLEKQITDNKIKTDSRNFLFPVSYQPESIDLLTLRDYNKKLLRYHPNFLLFDEVQRVPSVLQNIQNVLIRMFAPQKPWWKFNILLKKIQNFLGVTFVKSFFEASRLEKFQ